MKKTITIVALLALTIALTSCGGGNIVQAAAPPPSPSSIPAPTGTLITTPTLLSTDQIGNYIVQSGSLYGLPNVTGKGIKITGNVTVTGPALVQDLVIEGCLLIDRANRVEITRVWVQHCSTDGITLQSDPITPSTGNQSCCAKLDHVMSIANGGAGLKLLNTADVFISMSEFENNATYGALLIGSPTARIQNSDFGGNALGGFYADPGSALEMLSNDQFGNNQGDDLTLLGLNSVVNGMEFIGPPGFCSIRYNAPQNIGVNATVAGRGECRQ